MRVLFINPRYPYTYWGMQYGLPLTGKAVSLPPLGLITVAALLPRQWQVRLVELNAGPLRDEDLLWADVVATGGMRTQADSIHEIVRRAHRWGRRVVVGGPAASSDPDAFADADVVFVGEAEGRPAALVEALQGNATGVRLTPDGPRPDITTSPIPRFELLPIDQYASMAVQYSRGCPFNCEFCDIVSLFGRLPRVKTPDQVTGELSRLRELGYTGSVFVVDDNFIGSRRAVRDLLQHLHDWQAERSFPFELYTEASVDLAADDALIRAMLAAGFSAVFLGIESPSAEALAGAGKKQNLRCDLVEAVETLTRAGLEVMGGFIVGFDQDSPATFEAQRAFIERVNIPLAMVGLLTALPGTALSARLEREGRLRENGRGDNFWRPNFDPSMDERTLLSGYAALLRDLYEPSAYFARCESFVRSAPRTPGARRLQWSDVATGVRTAVQLGIKSPWRRAYWHLLWTAVRHGRHNLAWAFGHAVMGQHMIRYTQETVLPRLREAVRTVAVEQLARSPACEA